MSHATGRHRAATLLMPVALALSPWTAPVAQAQLAPLIANVPAVPAPTCVGCGGQGSHSDSCPYMGRGSSSRSGDDGESRGGGDITHAPIIVAPVGAIGGLVMGGGWFWNEMAGDYPDKGFFTSYVDYLTQNSGDPLFDKPFNFGAKIGGAPWLALYLPAYPIRQGILGVGSLFSSDPKKAPVAAPDAERARQAAVNRAIAACSAQQAAATAAALDKARRLGAEAESRRLAYLDARVAENPEWVALRLASGKEAARAAAEAWLDRLVRQREANLRIIDATRARLHGDADEIRRADKVADKSVGGFLTDTTTDALKPKWLETDFPRTTKGAEALKVANEVREAVKSLDESRRAAAAEGKDAWRWFSEPETREASLRLALKLVTSAPLPKSVTTAASVTETSVDIAYAATTRILLGAQMEADTRLLEKIAATGVFRDATADEYAALVRRRDLASAEEARLQRTLTAYRDKQRAYEKKSASPAR